LKLKITFLKSGPINLHWTFNSFDGVEKVPFEVPLDIVDPKKEERLEGGILSDYVEIR